MSTYIDNLLTLNAEELERAIDLEAGFWANNLWATSYTEESIIMKERLFWYKRKNELELYEKLYSE